MDAEALEDLFRPFGRVTVKRMFGGQGVYRDGLIFALATQGEVFLKTDAESRPQFEAAGLKPFAYESARKGLTETSYFQLAPAAHDDEAELTRWCELAVAAAQRAAARKTKTQPAAKKPIVKRPVKKTSLRQKR
jgi:DNA transformation protein